MAYKMRLQKGVLFLGLGVSFLLSAPLLKAKTIEVESDDEVIEASPTPVSAPAGKNKPAPTVQPAASQLTPTPVSENTETNLSEVAPPQPRTRISDKVGFYYFIKAGFVADSSSLSPIGKVVGSFDYNANYTNPKETYVETTGDKAGVSVGDLLVVYRLEQPLGPDESMNRPYQVENLAIVKVIEIQTKRYRVQVIKPFRPFKAGDSVELYDKEVQRWKQAQIKKLLPTHPVKALVLGGELGRASFDQLDFIYLSAGTKNGVVEGQVFELKQIIDTGVLEESLHAPRGKAQVIYAGADYSTAQILFNHEPIEKGFEALYQYP
jgi:hypothetical protein